MLILENIGLAFSAIRANISRSLLTMLGIIIGIMSVITIFTLGNSLNGSFEDDETAAEIKKVSFWVQEKERGRGFGGIEMSNSDYITPRMIEDVVEHYSDMIDGSAHIVLNAGSAKARDGIKYANVSVRGVNRAGYRGMYNEVVAGREFTRQEYYEGRSVALVSSLLCQNMFDGDNEAAIGQNILVKSDEGRYFTYKIIGVYRYQTGWFSSEAEEDTETDLYIPLLTEMNQYHNDKIDGFDLCAKDISMADDLYGNVVSYLNSRYYAQNPRFKVKGMSITSMIEDMMEMLNTMTVALSAVAGISLLVGGIGVMNIMMVSVTERTREIGTRKALGATNSSIRLQFVTEAMVICSIGGIIGILLGSFIGVNVSKMIFDVEGTVSVASIFISVGFSLFIGLFFGYYPANKAAKLNPIDALRYE